MRKVFVIDTSVFVYDPNSLKSFTGNDVVIPITVLDELDKLKSQPSEAGKNARVFIRMLDALCADGDLIKGIKIDGDILLKIDTKFTETKKSTQSLYGDTRILECATGLKSAFKRTQVVLVSKDINLRIRARAFGIKSEDYEKDKIHNDELYTGYVNIVDPVVGEVLSRTGHVDVNEYDLNELLPNQCVTFYEKQGGKGMCLGKRAGNKVQLVKNANPWGLDLKNREQAMATDLLLDHRIPLVTLMGIAGGGKTLIALAAALEQTVNSNQYKKIIIMKPVVSIGKDMGALPGDLREKLSPYVQSLVDNLEFLFSGGKSNKAKVKTNNISNEYLSLLFDKKIIEMEAISYVRGRSIPNAFIVVDECQNISHHEVKTILTRAGTGTKIVLTGDIEQIDNSYLDATNNGLAYVIEKFKTSELAGHITLTKGERSPLASKAAEIL